MFLLYYVWGFFFFIISKTHNFIEDNFLVKNNPFLIRKRTFKFISYFEKLFLSFFYKKGWFEKSLANLYRKNDIIDYRRKNHPLIQIFHLKFDKSNYKFSSLNLIVNQYIFYTNSSIFKIKLLKLFGFCFKKNTNNFLKYLILQNIMFKKYFNYIDNMHFFKYNELNSLKLNFLFNIILINCRSKYVLYDLSKWVDWYEYNYSGKVKTYLKKSKISSYEFRKLRDFRRKKIENWIKVVYKYKKLYKPINRFFLVRNIIIFFKYNIINIFKIRFTYKFIKNFKKKYLVKFSDSSVTKFILPGKIKNYSIFYLRKNRIFNKGRYSRNRQLYRTGVYWCLWLNIIMVYGLYFIFYRFSFNFGYIWWGVLILAYSTIFSRILKYNFFNLIYIYREFLNLQKWVGYLILNFFNFLKELLSSYFNNINLFNYISNYKSTNYSFLFNNFYYYISKILNYFLTFEKNVKIGFFWQGMKEKDKSFLRYKTLLHWLEQLYKLITT